MTAILKASNSQRTRHLNSNYTSSELMKVFCSDHTNSSLQDEKVTSLSCPTHASAIILTINTGRVILWLRTAQTTVTSALREGAWRG